ncbi:hypothetical protein DFH27DRAFT_577950 [Peziza echinospora]|nr:hypothetical protein DFH27DRAFT_577950 [Peziza echinospora]
MDSRWWMSNYIFNFLGRKVGRKILGVYNSYIGIAYICVPPIAIWGLNFFSFAWYHVGNFHATPLLSILYYRPGRVFLCMASLLNNIWPCFEFLFSSRMNEVEDLLVVAPQLPSLACIPTTRHLNHGHSTHRQLTCGLWA